METDPGIPAATAAATEIVTQGCSWAAAGSHRGLNRPNNEDDFLCAPERGLFIVCDGMGGHAAGEVASEEAIEALNQALPPEGVAQALGAGEESVARLLRQAMEQANQRVLGLAQENPSWEGMASTAVIVLLDANRLYVSNLGDSRAYQVRAEHVLALTKDHSVAAALVDQGQLTPDEVRTHPLRNHLTASLGIPQPVAPAYTSVAVQPGDRIVLCSDGLWDMLTDAETAQLTIAHPDPHAAVKALIAAANAAGGQDNITVIVIIAGAEETAAEEAVQTDTIAAATKRGGLGSALRSALAAELLNRIQRVVFS